MNTLYLSDATLEGVVGGAGQDVMSYNPESRILNVGFPIAVAGVLIQDLTAVPANPAAYGDTGIFRIREDNPNTGNADDIGGHALIGALGVHP